MHFHQLCLQAFSGSSFIAQLWRQQDVSYCLVSAISCPCMVGLCAYEIALSRLAPSRSLTQAIAQMRRKAGGHSGLPAEPKAHAKAPGNVTLQRFPALIISSHVGGCWFVPGNLNGSWAFFIFVDPNLFVACQQPGHVIAFRILLGQGGPGCPTAGHYWYAQ